MVSYIIGGLFITTLAILWVSGNHKLRIKVKSIEDEETYIAEKKKDVRGNNFLDWFYYDEDGESIKDENLKKMIFEAFSDEDWYGAYEFYTKTSEAKKVEKTEEEAA